MEVDPAQVLQYYRRAAEDAGVFRRQGPDGPTSTASTAPPESSTAVTSSVSTASTVSTLSTASTQSTLSTLSTRSTLSTSSSRSSSSSTQQSSSSTIIVTTTSSAIQTTDSQGQVITSYVFVSATNTVPAGSSGGGGGSTNTGAIVGGVIGGIALVVLIGLGVWLVRRKMKKDEFEANIFDPDRNVERPASLRPGQNFDMAAAGVPVGRTSAAEREAANVTPYSYAPTSTGPTTASHYGSSVGGQPEMQQAHNTGLAYYHDMPQAPYQDHNYGNWNAPSVNVGETFPNPYAPNYHPAAMAGGAALAGGAGAAAAHRAYATSPSNTSNYPASTYPPTSIHSPPPPSTGRISPNSPPMAAGASLAPTNPRSAKEREAFSRTYQNQGYTVSNPSEAGAPARSNPSPTPSRSSATGGAGPTSPVRVHQDGGRVPDEDEGEPAGEIPPTYDSIPRDPAAR